MSDERPAHKRKLPTRLHHHAFVVADHERTRHFYEDIIGMPLRAAWIEAALVNGERLEFCHAFFGLEDGSALAFFNYIDKQVQQRFYAGPQPNMGYHIALNVDAETQDEIFERCQAAGMNPWMADHGYCKSLYVTDPDGLNVEFTVDPPGVEAINAEQQRIAHESLKRWQAGDTRPTNFVRPHD
jgi:glyoxylase I family protein